MKKFSKYFTVLALVLFVALSAFISCQDPSDDSLTPEQAEAAFWVAFDDVVNEKVGDVAAVDIDGTDITVEFKEDGDNGLPVATIKTTAENLFVELKELVDAGELTLTLDGKEEGETFKLTDEDVVSAVATYLLGETAPGDFSGTVEADYTAKVTYKGVPFETDGELVFSIYEEG